MSRGGAMMVIEVRTASQIVTRGFLDTIPVLAPAGPFRLVGKHRPPDKEAGHEWNPKAFYLICMSFFTDVTPATPRARLIALLAAACELTKPLS